MSECEELISNHPVCRAIAGIPTEFPNSDILEPRDFDKTILPEKVFAILDCDSSQHQAILAVKQGGHLVLDGPPGTGKSQTIANIIAEFLAEGKKVLFVSEKAAAPDVVKKRLDEKNLGDFCLDCHNVRRNKRSFIEDIGKCLKLPGEIYEKEGESFRKLYQVRAELNTYVDSLHKKHGQMGLTAYQCLARLALLKQEPSVEIPFPPPMDVSQDNYNQWIKTLDQLKLLRETIQWATIAHLKDKNSIYCASF